jgi:hypothetical protein
MSDLSEIYNRINDMSKDVAVLKNQLNRIEPTLVSVDSTKVLINEHKEQCNKMSGFSKIKQSGVPVGIAAIIVGLVELFKMFSG